MKNMLFVFVIMLLNTGCSEPEQSLEKDQSNDTTTISYGKSDLYKIKWIEGNWKGMVGQNPFYEIYRFTNDSTIMITSYEWNGKDSSKSSADYIQWKGDGYYLGKDQNWKVISITDTVIKMIPVKKASNDVTWQFKDSASWDAVLVSKEGTVLYHMQRFDAFKK